MRRERRQRRRVLPIQFLKGKRRQSDEDCLAHKKYIRFSNSLLTLLKALRHMFRSNEDPPLALEAESSNWRPPASGLMWNAPRAQTSYKKKKDESESWYFKSRLTSASRNKHFRKPLIVRMEAWTHNKRGQGWRRIESLWRRHGRV